MDSNGLEELDGTVLTVSERLEDGIVHEEDRQRGLALLSMGLQRSNLWPASNQRGRAAAYRMM